MQTVLPMNERRSLFSASLAALFLLAAGGCGSDGEATGGAGSTSTGDGTSSGPKDVCGNCADSKKPYFCFATEQCGAKDGSDCPYGVVDRGAECENPQVPEQTNLPFDCRHPRAQDDPRCEAYGNLGTPIGAGFDVERYQMGDGFVDTANNRLVLTFNCLLCPDEDTGVLAIDLDTGDRTLLSGHYNDTLDGAVEVGAGEQPSSLDAVKVLPNGKWVALDNIAGEAEIYEIDPATGDRTVLYTQEQLVGDITSDGEGGSGVCKVDGWVSLGVGHNHATTEATGAATTLLVGADGTLYLRAERFGTPTQDLNIAAIVGLKDGACSIVTLWSGDVPAVNVGTGPDIFFPYNWLIDDGDRILAQRGSFLLHAIDKATGNRSIVSAAIEGSERGSGPELGDSYALLSTDGATLHTVGSEIGEGMVDVTLATGDRVPHGFLALDNVGAFRTRGPIFPYPKIPGVFMIAPEGGVILYEPRTGNFNNFSH